MLDLSNFSSDGGFGKPGRNPTPLPMLPRQARHKALELLSNGLPPKLDRAVNLLSMGGIMTAAQMGVSPRTLQRYRDFRVVDRIPHNASVILDLFKVYGLLIPEQQSKLLLFTLGPVGIEISKMRYEMKPPSGYLGYSLDRMMHDVVVNEIVLHISRQARVHGWVTVWVSEGKAALYRNQQQLIKPDAMLRLKKDGEEFLYLIEYHNEDHSSRTKQKVQQYERIRYSDEWREIWMTDIFPPVLAAFRYSIVGRGYAENINARESMYVNFYGRMLPSIFKDIDRWFNFSSEQKEYVWPWSNNLGDCIIVCVFEHLV
jgi:hypothetical protein